MVNKPLQQCLSEVTPIKCMELSFTANWPDTNGLRDTLVSFAHSNPGTKGPGDYGTEISVWVAYDPVEVKK